MNKKKILIVNNDKKQCGIYQHGISLYKILVKSKLINFEYAECNSSNTFLQNYRSIKPDVVIFNHNSTTMPWLNKSIINKIKGPAVSILHTISQNVADKLTDSIFDFFLTDDPTILLQNPYLYKYGRLIQPVIKNNYESSIPIIGSFGLCLPNKGFERLVYLVQTEFDEAIINLHIPFSDYNNNIHENIIIKKCKDIIIKPGITLNITTGFLEKSELVDMMSKNTINAFLYDEDRGNGEQISGVMEYAISANRPIAITRCPMFRHFLTEYPNMCCIEDKTFTEIINSDLNYLGYFQNLWNENNVIWDFERTIQDVILKYSNNYKLFIKPFKRIKRGYFKFSKSFKLNNSAEVEEIRKPWYYEFLLKRNNNIKYLPTNNNPLSLNCILDNSYRDFYKSQIQQIYQISNKSTERKIPESLVQHAFILDTVYKYIKSLNFTPRILSIGSYEDSVTSCLKLLGFLVDTIDPILNYDLTTFMSKPTTCLDSYDIVFSTSVLEHVEEDEIFMNNMSKLLKKNGIGLITCDFKKEYKKGDPKLNIDYRFYTKNDLENRIIPNLENCQLLSISNWDYVNPDFFHCGHNYTFASLSFIKK